MACKTVCFEKLKKNDVVIKKDTKEKYICKIYGGIKYLCTDKTIDTIDAFVVGDFVHA